MKKWLRRRDLLQDGDETEDDKDGLGALAASAVSGTPAAGGTRVASGSAA